MKLKKIATLMLAGIMAVSMLAGCKSGDKEPTNPENPVVPATSDLVDYANDGLTDVQKERFTYNDNTTLNTLLQNLATNKDKVTVTMISDAYSETNNTADNCVNQSLSNELKKNLTGGTYFAGRSEWNNWTNKVPATGDKTDYYVEVYMFSGMLSEEAIAKSIVDKWSDAAIDSSFPAKIGDTELDYSADISAVRVANTSDDSKTAWVAAIMISKTIGSNENVVA